MAAVQLGFDFTKAKGQTPRVAARNERPKRITAPASAVPEGADSSPPLAPLATALERTLQARVRTPLRLTVTDNRRTMLSLRRHQTLVEVRLHHMFLQGEPSVWEALGDYLLQGDRSASLAIARYIEQHRKQIRRAPRRTLTLSTAGEHHDLREIYRAINARYFDDSVDVRITWGRDASEAPRAVRRSIKLGSYTSRDRLIRVHPALDAEFVPRFFVEYIVYHEMLHHVLPPTQLRGRRDLHGATFQAREREFVDYHAALLWEHDNLGRLLRSRTVRAPSGSKRARTGY
jgi:predicted metal-dependent hydrolase